MSYILDALKKAEPRREMDLSAPPPPVMVSYAQPDWQPRLLRLALWLLVTAVVLIALAWGWRLWGTGLLAANHSQPVAEVSDAPPTAAAEPKVQAAVVAAQPAATVVGRVPAVSARQLSWPPQEMERTDDSSQLPSGALEPALPPDPADYRLAGASLDDEALPDFSAPPSERAAVETVSRKPEPLAGDLLRQQFEAAVAATAPVQQKAAVPLASLPPQFQKSVPPLAFSQHLYSSDPGQRWVRVNGRDAREGERIAPGLVLERIEPQQVVLSLNGQLFAMPALTDWH